MKKILYLFLGIIGVFIVLLYFIFLIDNTSGANYSLKLKEPQSKEGIIDSLTLHQALRSEWTFRLSAYFLGLDSIPIGHYSLAKSTSNFRLIHRLKNGYQSPVSCVVSTANNLEELSSKLQKYVVWDSTQIINFVLADSNQSKYRYNKENALCFFIPNTYEVYWNSSLEKVMSKIAKQNEEFWNHERQNQADQLGLSPNEVYIIASMVQKEFSQKSERSKIAGVIYNRLKINMPLQIDATCKFATKDYAAKRITNVHLNFDSPYNTYKNRGLPPGPICIPECSTIDAVLRLDRHAYLYYCADPSMNGFHIFSETMSSHRRVASDYHQKLDQIGIK
jgi:UPF0755 protein